MSTLTISPNRLAQYWALTKPRVTQLAVFCAVIGMFLATPELPDWRLVVAATVGIWLLAGAAFAVNCWSSARSIRAWRAPRGGRWRAAKSRWRRRWRFPA